jgi:hypothetical protein
MESTQQDTTDQLVGDLGRRISQLAEIAEDIKHFLDGTEPCVSLLSKSRSGINGRINDSLDIISNAIGDLMESSYTLGVRLRMNQNDEVCGSADVEPVRKLGYYAKQ